VHVEFAGGSADAQGAEFGAFEEYIGRFLGDSVFSPPIMPARATARSASAITSTS
jgi:hypothetical protein